MSVPRAIRKIFLAVEQAEGAGARVRRSIGTPQLRNLSPFLMLDHFSIKPGAGFPDHPHRGQETITYLLQGGVISGQSHGVDSVRDLAYTPVWILDLQVKPGGKVAQPLPANWNAFAYVLEGQALFGAGDQQRPVEQYHNVVLEQEGDVVNIEVDAGADKDARVVLIAGTPLDQPVVQYGPFVLSSKEEVYQALQDYQTHSNGFERAEGWQSEIGKSMIH
ncbi:Pirin like protein [Verticillium longisporum]|uniref:Pirin like protein n=1 Tax=Verticillium longisporum TaxID=100787 RepID=A0A8I3AGA6_VERLO|nr:Pirin like protein [Verticillium longisporum]